MNAHGFPAPGKDGEERVTCVGCGARRRILARVFKPVVISSSCSAAEENKLKKRTTIINKKNKRSHHDNENNDII